MTKINCKACNCGYNENSYCKKKKVNVEGIFAKSKIGTFCESFLNPNRDSKVYTEMAKEMFDTNSPVTETKIMCSANYCRHNTENVCHAKEIQVGSAGSKYRSETECDSFSLK